MVAHGYPGRYPARAMNAKCNFKRGFQMAGVFGSSAFVLSLACGALYYSYYFAINDFDDARRQYELNVYPLYLLTPAIAVLLLFGISAFAAFTPNKQLPFVRCLLTISMSATIAVLLLSSVAPVKSVPWVNPGYALFCILIVLATAAFLVMRAQKTDSAVNREIAG